MFLSQERSCLLHGLIHGTIKENRDFFDYVELVRQFYQTGNPRAKDWDHYAE